MKKFISLLVVAAFALSFLPVAKADTISDLNTQIAALQTQIIALQGDTSTATFCWHANLKLGMRSNDVKLMQEKLGVSNTGYFGPLTLAAVKNFQALNGVPATGFVGELTRAQLNLKYCLGTPPTTLPGVVYPAGCTSSVGYSSTTGVLCATGVVAYPAGCTSAAGYSITTGKSCAGVVTYPAGCTSSVGFSSTTGVSCATGVTTTSSTGEASLATSSAPVYVISNLKGGDIGKNIFAFNLKATNADATLNRVDLRIQNLAPTSLTVFPWRSLKSVSLYDGSSLLKTVDASLMANYSEVAFGTDYILRFDGISDLILKDQTKTLTFVADVQGTPYLDATAGILANVNFKFSVSSASSIRATDSIGSQYATYAATQNVALAQNAAGATIVLTANTSSPKVGIINAVNITDPLLDKTVFIFDVQSQGTDSTIKTLLLNAAETTATETTAVSLYDGSNPIASSTIVGGVVTFNNLNIALLKDTTKTLTVKVNVKPVDGVGAFVTDAITIGFRSLIAVDSNYNSPATPAAVAGTAQKLYVKAPVFTFVSASLPTKTTSGGATAETINGYINFSVTAQGQDVYITDTQAGANGVILAKQVANGTPAATVYTFTQMNITSSDADYAAGVYKIANGTTRNFSAAYVITVAGANGYNGAMLTNAWWSTNADGITGAVDFGFMMPTARSAQISINK
jgi:peptidoglycan hydrolase-like protein with peptidoglycan-binding domain